MNIFVLDYNPARAARMQCDKHVVKMPLESAQILCAAFPNGVAPYRQTHRKHPAVLWALSSRQNYLWLIEHGLALCDEYKYRYEKNHKSREVILWCREHMDELYFPKEKRTPFALCMDEEHKVGNAVESYRCYYKRKKASIASWKKRNIPQWFKN